MEILPTGTENCGDIVETKRIPPDKRVGPELQKNPENPGKPSGLSRREFLRGLAALAGGAFLAACGLASEEELRGPVGRPTAAPFRALQSPQPPDTGEEIIPGTGELSLSAFLALSSVLTGFDNLQPEVGRVYLESLQSGPDRPVTLVELYERSGFRPESSIPGIEALEEAGVFDDEDTRELAHKIIEYWYTGVYDVYVGEDANGNGDGNGKEDGAGEGAQNGNGEDGEDNGAEQGVATYVDALVWKSMDFTKPPTICMWPQSWSADPRYLR